MIDPPELVLMVEVKVWNANMESFTLASLGLSFTPGPIISTLPVTARTLRLKKSGSAQLPVNLIFKD